MVVRSADDQSRPVVEQCCRVIVSGRLEAGTCLQSARSRVVQLPTVEHFCVTGIGTVITKASSRDQYFATGQQRDCCRPATLEEAASAPSPRDGIVDLDSVKCKREGPPLASGQQDVAVWQRRQGVTVARRVDGAGKAPGLSVWVE